MRDSRKENDYPKLQDDEIQDKCRLCPFDLAMLPYKVTLSFFTGANGAFPLYFPLYLREVGLTAEQIGIVQSPMSIGGLIGAILCGYVTPRFASEKNAFTVCLLLKLALVGTMGYIPLPKQVSYLSNCTDIFGNLSSNDVTADKSWLFDADGVLFNVRVYTTISCILGMCFSWNHTLIDSLIMNALGSKRRTEYGQQRSLGTIFFGVVSCICGVLTSLTISVETICGIRITFTNFHLTFYGFMICCLATTLGSRFLGNEKKEENSADAAKTQKDKEEPHQLSSIFGNVRNGSWLLVMFCTSALHGVSSSFLFWHLGNLGATPLLMGNMSFMGLLVECVAFWISPRILRILGFTKCIYFGMLGQIGQFVLYSAIVNPMWVIPAQIMSGITYCFTKCALTAFTCSIATKRNMVKITGVFSAAFCIGAGVGIYSAGLLVHNFGAPIMFAFFAMATAFTLVLFLMAQIIHSTILGQIKMLLKKVLNGYEVNEIQAS